MYVCVFRCKRPSPKKISPRGDGFGDVCGNEQAKSQECHGRTTFQTCLNVLRKIFLNLLGERCIQPLRAFRRAGLVHRTRCEVNRIIIIIIEIRRNHNNDNNNNNNNKSVIYCKLLMPGYPPSHYPGEMVTFSSKIGRRQGHKD